MTTDPDERDPGDVAWDGLIAGCVGGLTVAAWFLVVDLLAGDPLRTPALLGTAVLEGAAAVPETEAIHTDAVAIYSGIHMGLFALFGVVVAAVIHELRMHPILGFLLVFLAVFYEFGFFVFVLAYAEPLAAAIPAWQILVGNALAGAVMAGYFVVRNPDLPEVVRFSGEAPRAPER